MTDSRSTVPTSLTTFDSQNTFTNTRSDPACPLKCSDVMYGFWCGATREVLEVAPFPTFAFSFWFKEFVVQTLYPFTLPYLHWTGLAEHQHFKNSSWWVGLLQHIMQPLTWAALIWWLIDPKVSDAGITLPEVLSSFLSLLANRACIATKYGFLTAKEYREFQNSDVTTARKWLFNMQILTSWYAPRTTIVVHETWMAAKQLGLNVRHLYITVKDATNKDLFREYLAPTDTDEYKRYVDLTQRQGSSGEWEIPVFQILTSCVIRCLGDDIPKYMIYIINVICIIRSGIFGIIRQAEGSSKYGFFGDSAASCVMTIIQFVLSYLWFRTVLMFIGTAVVDIFRRLRMVREIGDMIRICPEKREGHPTIDLAVINNIAGWVAMRRMIRHIGYRFQLRLQVYLLVSQVLCLIFAAELLGTVASSSHPQTLRHDPQLVQSLTDLLVLWVPMGLTMILGALVNRQIRDDLESLISHRVRARTKLLVTESAELRRDKSNLSKSDFDAYFKDLEQESAADDLLDTSIQALESLDQSAPISVLGVRAEFQLLVSTTTVLSSMLIYVGRTVYLRN